MTNIINKYIYLCSRFFLNLSDSIYVFVIGFYILDTTGSAFLFTLNIVIAVIISLISLPIIGVLSDLKDNRKIILISEFLYAMTFVFIFLIIFFFNVHILIFYLSTVILTLVSQFAENSFQTSFIQLFKEDKVQNVLSYNSIVLSTSDIIGPILGGLLYSLIGLKNTIFLLAIFAILSYVLDLFLKFDEKIINSMESESRSFFDQILEGVKYVRENYIIKKLMIFSAVIGFTSAGIFIYPRTLLIDYYDFSAESVGVFSTILGIGSILGGLVLSYYPQKNKNPIKIAKKSSIIIGCLFVIISLPILFSFERSLVFTIFTIIGFLITLFMQFSNIPIMTYYQLNIKDEMKGRVFAVMGVISMVFMPLGMIVFSLLLDLGLPIIVNILFGFFIVITTLLILDKKTISNV